MEADTPQDPMAYYIDLFSPETYEAFSRSSRDVSGFRPRQMGVAERINPGDLFVCYVTRLSRWFGLLEVVDGPFQDNKPIFASENDPYTVRFHVRPKVWLDMEHAIPIHDQLIWDNLSFTSKLNKDSLAWTGKVRGSLVKLDDADGNFLLEVLTAQAQQKRLYPLDEQDVRRLKTHVVTRQDKVVSVTVPEDVPAPEEQQAEPSETRDSHKMQALIASIGAEMGMQIWIPKADRASVTREWKPDDNQLLERLPLNYDDVTLRTIEQIDVIWLKRRAIVRAFEVEHTTSVYSGILRMADLLSLQPNMDIKLHIVAPDTRREKVFQEIRRPVFSLLDKGPLAESCTYLSYDSLEALSEEKHLSHMADSVLDEYAEEAE
jgi:predicted RNA-binding protein